MTDDKAAMTVKSSLLHLEINGWCVVEDVIPKDAVEDTFTPHSELLSPYLHYQKVQIVRSACFES